MRPLFGIYMALLIVSNSFLICYVGFALITCPPKRLLVLNDIKQIPQLSCDVNFV